MTGRMPKSFMRAPHHYQPLLREIGLDADAVFADPRIVVWRDIAERQNCTLDHACADGRRVRLHVKRYLPVRGPVSPAEEEARGIRALETGRIPTLALVAWGRVDDGRSFVVTEDLYAFRAADKAVADRSLAFDRLLEPTADLAARLHGENLHHRDLYLCHFFARAAPASGGGGAGGGGVELRLIDAARVRPLPAWFTRGRWIVKDLAQFWYSTLDPALGVTDDQRARWLDRYGRQRNLGPAAVARLRARVERKARAIGRHDARLQARVPTRNVSIPGA